MKTPDEQLLELVELLGPDDPEYQLLKEYALGGKSMKAKYLQRLGVPGNYQYNYANYAILGMSRKAQSAYGRFVKKSNVFLKKLRISMDATSMNTKPLTWRNMLVTVKRRDNSVFNFQLDLLSHNITPYLAHKTTSGGSEELSKAKRAGILRYR